MQWNKGGEITVWGQGEASLADNESVLNLDLTLHDGKKTSLEISRNEDGGVDTALKATWKTGEGPAKNFLLGYSFTNNRLEGILEDRVFNLYPAQKIQTKRCWRLQTRE